MDKQMQPPCHESMDAAHVECRHNRERLATYERFFNECPIGLYMTRCTDGLFLDINLVGARMLGYDSPEEVIGKVYSTELYSREDRQKVLDALAKDGRLTDHEARFCRKDGTCIWVSLSATNGGERIIGSIQDISERKELEEEIEKLHEQMMIPLRVVEQNAKQRLLSFDKSAAEFERRAQIR